MAWREWPTYSAACRRDVQQLLRAGHGLTAYQANPQHGPGPTRGSWAWKLEREAERVHCTPHVIACTNGTLALTTLLRILYPRGGTIVTTALTFSATVTSILHAGLTPYFSDVSLQDGLLDLECTKLRSNGFLPVDLFGKRSWGGDVVDACQSVGVRPLAKHGVWSFNGRKNVPAGEGGAIFTSDADVADRCRLELGHAENFADWTGRNGHMNELTACLAYHGMQAVRQRNAHRLKMAGILNRILAGAPIITPNLRHHALYSYPLIVERDMEQVADQLARRGVECQRGYIQPPLHEYSAFKHLRHGALPNTESLSRDRLLLFPQVTPTATRAEMEQLGDAIKLVTMRKR